MFAKNENNLIRYDTTNNKNVSDVLGTAYYIYIFVWGALSKYSYAGLILVVMAGNFIWM